MTEANQSAMKGPKPLRVLMVEDSEDDALLEIRALKKGGYDPEYTRVETAEAMSNALRANPWDIILCDYKLPTFSAPAAIALLKETTIDIPLIIVSGTIGEETAVECMRLGAHDYFVKGNLTRLPVAVERELAEAQSRKELTLAEEAFIATEFRFEELFHNMSNCAAVYEVLGNGTDFIFKDFNRAAEKTEKMDRKDVIGKSVLDVFPNAQEMGLLEVLERVWKTGQAEQMPPFYYRDERIAGWRVNYLYKLPTGEVVTLYNDITERKNAERKLFESEEKYRLVVENSSEAIFIAQDGMFKFLNKASLKLFGAPYEVIISQPFTELIHPDDRERVMSSHLKRLRGEAVPASYNFRALTASGAVRWVEIHSTLVSWQGKPATLNFLTDFTERKLAEQQLGKEVELKNFLIELYQKALVLSDNELFDYILEKMVRFSDSTIGFLHLVSEDQNNAILTAWNTEALRNCTASYATHYPIDQAGNWVDCVRLKRPVIYNEFSSSPNQKGLPEGHTPIKRFMSVPVVEGDKVRIIFGVGNKSEAYNNFDETGIHIVANELQRIMSRRRTEDKLRESEKKYRDLFDFLPIPVYEMDFDANIASANRAIYETFRGTEEDLKSGFKGWQLLSPEDIEKSKNNISALLKGEQISGTEYNMMRLDGSVFPAIVISSVIYSDGQPTGLRGAVIDMTERKQAEEALQKSQNQLQNAYQMAQIGSWSWDLNSKTIVWSEEFSRITGLDLQVKAFPEKKHPRIYTPESWNRLKKAVAGSLKTGKPHQLELEVVHPDGNNRWFNWLGDVMLDKQGKLAGLHGTAQDITGRKLAEEKLQHISVIQNLILDNSTLGIALVRNRVFEWVNARLGELLLLPLEQIQGFPTRVIYPSTEAYEEMGRDAYPMIARGERSDNVIQLMRSDGTLFWCRFMGKALNPEKPQDGSIWMLEDITERKQAEEKINQSEEKYRLLAENTSDLIWMEDAQTFQYTYVSASVERIMGYTREEFLQLTPQDLVTTSSAKTASKFFAQSLKAAAAGLPVECPPFEAEGFRKDGSRIWAEINYSLVYNNSGKVISIQGINRDITERKKVHFELQKKNLELAEAYEELRKKQAMVIQQEKMASIGMLASGIAHEIKNPLAIVLQGINYLQTTVTDDSLMTEVVDRMNNAVLRADIIVKGLLSYARQEVLSLAEQDIPPLIDESLVLAEHEFRKKNLRLIKQYAPDLPKACVDSGQIKQVFINLLMNGCDAMTQSGTFTISVRKIGAASGKKLLEISFQDTGHGIPDDKINSIFDPFYTTKAVGNTGLGLSITKGIIDSHGGIIYAENQQEQGAKFTILLPVQ